MSSLINEIRLALAGNYLKDEHETREMLSEALSEIIGLEGTIEHLARDKSLLEDEVNDLHLANEDLANEMSNSEEDYQERINQLEDRIKDLYDQLLRSK